jgi:hypothetical protein
MYRRRCEEESAPLLFRHGQVVENHGRKFFEKVVAIAPQDAVTGSSRSTLTNLTCPTAQAALGLDL